MSSEANGVINSQSIPDIRQLKYFIAPIKLPILDWLPYYSSETFFNDLIAGLTVFVLLIPQGMAYSILAGMPAVYGLYSATVPLIIYAIFGTSRQLSIGPMAITSLVIANSVSRLGYSNDNMSEYTLIITNLSMLCGVVMLIIGLFRLGILANLISFSVLTGFVTASSLLISLSQLKYILGITVPRFTYVHQTIIYLVTHLNECNVYSLLIGITAWILLQYVKNWKKQNKRVLENSSIISYRILSILADMSSLFSIFIGSIVSYFLIRYNHNIHIVGLVPSGLQYPSFQFAGFETLTTLFPSAVVLALISFSGNWAIALKFAGLNSYEVDATQELIAQGLSNIIGVFFNSFVVSGGLARSAVNADGGAKTQMSSILSALFIIISIELFTPVFYYIPMAVLGAIIEVSVIPMIDFDSMIKAYYIDQKDCAIMVITFGFSFFIGVSEGILIGVMLSIISVLNSSANPQIAHLGKLPTTEGGHWKNIRRFNSAKQIPGIAVVRMDASLYFANTSNFKETVLAASQRKYHSDSFVPIELVVLDASEWNDIDLSGINCLVDIHEELIKKDIQLALAYTKFQLRGRLRKAKFVDKLGEKYFSMSIDDAVNTLPTRRSELDNEKEAVESKRYSSKTPVTFQAFVPMPLAPVIVESSVNDHSSYDSKNSKSLLKYQNVNKYDSFNEHTQIELKNDP